jgi:MFS family permease
MMVLSTGPFLVAFALILGGSNTTIGMLAAVGPLAQLLQIPAIFLVENIRRRKAITVVSAVMGRSSLFGMAMLPWLAPEKYRIPLFVLFLACHYGIGAIAGCAFSSWLRDLIPGDRMGAFFARRLTFSTAAGALLGLLGGVAIDVYRANFDNPAGAYTIVFSLAGLAGMVSVFFMGRTAEPTMPPEESVSLWKMLFRPFRDTNFRNLLIFLAWWSAAVNFAAPFFTVYLLHRIGLNMTWVLLLSVVSQITNVLFFGVWGRLSDQFTNKSVLVFSVPLFFISFLFWPFTTLPERHIMSIPLLIAIHVIAGMATAGVALCANNLAMKTAPYGKAASYLAVNALVSGAAATVSPVLAGFAADWFEPYELQLTLSFTNWTKEYSALELPTFDLKGLDFVFVIAFFIGVYCFHRLLAVREKGEVTEQVLRQAFLGEIARMVRQVSSVAGLRQIVSFPFAYLIALRKK